MKKMLLTLLFTLLFTGCIERGQNLKPAPIYTTPVKIKPTQAISKVTPIKLEKSKLVLSSTAPYSEKCTASPKQTITKIGEMMKKPHSPNENVKDAPIFPLTDETKNKISGFFIFVIGIIILL